MLILQIVIPVGQPTFPSQADFQAQELPVVPPPVVPVLPTQGGDIVQLAPKGTPLGIESIIGGDSVSIGTDPLSTGAVQLVSLLQEGYSPSSSQVDFVLSQNNLKRSDPEIKEILDAYERDRKNIRKGVEAGFSPHDPRINMELLTGEESTNARNNIYYELKRERGMLPNVGIGVAGTVATILCPPVGLAVTGYGCYRAFYEEGRHVQAWNAFTSLFN